MTERQIQKELNRVAVNFEEACSHGYKATAVKFQDFAEEWFNEYARFSLRSTILKKAEFACLKLYSKWQRSILNENTKRISRNFRENHIWTAN